MSTKSLLKSDHNFGGLGLLTVALPDDMRSNLTLLHSYILVKVRERALAHIAASLTACLSSIW